MTTRPETPAGVYVHWPFCERKCPYCDFTTFGREHPFWDRAQEYRRTLVEEIETAPARFGWAAAPRLDTVYLGGGTPSLMGAEALAEILGALHRVFAFEPDPEITLELNPTTAEAAGIERLLALGVNRLSVGCQSFNDRVLARLGRVHDAATTRRAIERLRAAGVDNLSLDLIFGAPTQTLADFRDDLCSILEYAPEHVSAYNLTVHEGTPFARWAREGRLELPGEEAQVAMFETLMDTLAAAGYEHYEISNWARPGRASRHNAKYWRDADVYGFGVAAHGVAAHGVAGARRFANPSDLNHYLDPKRRAWAAALDAPAGERARRGEIMMLALRRVDGVRWAEVDAWLGDAARRFYEAEIARLRGDGLLESDDESFRLTRRGILIADTVMAEFF